VVHEARRIVLVEPDAAKRGVLAGRLASQGYQVDALGSGAEAADLALAAPPSAVIADLWMPGVSGVQLCRLLRSELATEHVPIILRGPDDTPRQRFWANRAGAAAYVVKGRIGELVRALAQAITIEGPSDGFFQIHPDEVDIRDRISRQLDAALYESVLAAEVRALSTCETLPRLFDLFAQFLCQVVTYRWLAVASREPPALYIHAHTDGKQQALADVRSTLQVGEDVPVFFIEDEDASNGEAGPTPLRRDLRFGAQEVGSIAFLPIHAEEEDVALMDLVAGELGGPIRIVTLVEKTERLASHDALTGLMNRRAFSQAIAREFSQADRLNIHLSLLLFDIDHFKSINDTHGHQTGDQVLTELGHLLRKATRDYDYPVRWGGEEFVVGLPHVDASTGTKIAERLRAAIESLSIETSAGVAVPVTASIGVATRRPGETLEALVERADRAMYAAKTSGRNRVVAAAGESRPVAAPPDAAGDAVESRRAGKRAFAS
jgi:two-component system cell cycle response regulator